MPMLLVNLFVALFSKIKGLLSGVVGGLFGAFGGSFVRKLSIEGVVLVTFIALTVAFIAAIDALLSVFAVNSPSGFFALAGMILPDNTSAVISMILSANVIRFVYRLHVQFLESKKQMFL